MKRKTLRKRVSKKSRKTRNKNMSKPNNMRNRKTRINKNRKKHYSRKMRGGLPEKLTTEKLTGRGVFKFDVETPEGFQYKNSNETIIVSELGDYLKRHLAGLSLKQVKFFLHINPEKPKESYGESEYTFDLYWASDFKDAGLLLNRKLSGIYYYNDILDTLKYVQPSFTNALSKLKIDKYSEVLYKIKTALAEHVVAEKQKAAEA